MKSVWTSNIPIKGKVETYPIGSYNRSVASPISPTSGTLPGVASSGQKLDTSTKRSKKVDVSSVTLLRETQDSWKYKPKNGADHSGILENVIEEASLKISWSDGARQIFEALDVNNNAVINFTKILLMVRSS